MTTVRICKKNYNKTDTKLENYDHLTGSYRRSIHSTGNLNFTVRNFIPIVFYNLTGYDSHHQLLKIYVMKTMKLM